VAVDGFSNCSSVQAVESTIGDIELAVSLVNKSAHEVSLLRVQKVQGWLQHQGHTTAGTIARDLGWPNAVGRVDGRSLTFALTIEFACGVVKGLRIRISKPFESNRMKASR